MYFINKSFFCLIDDRLYYDQTAATALARAVVRELPLPIHRFCRSDINK